MPTANTKAIGVAYCQTLASSDKLIMAIAQRYATSTSMAESNTNRRLINLALSLAPACMMVVVRGPS